MGLVDIYNIKTTNQWAVDFKVPLDIRDITLSTIRDTIDTAYYHCEDEDPTSTEYYLYLNNQEKEQLVDELYDLLIKIMFAKFTEKPDGLFINNSYIYMTEPMVVASVLYLIYGAQHVPLDVMFNTVIVENSTVYTWKHLQVIYLLAGPLCKSLLSHWFNLNKMKFLLPFEQTTSSVEEEDKIKEEPVDQEMQDLADIYGAYIAEHGAGLGLGVV